MCAKFLFVVQIDVANSLFIAGMFVWTLQYAYYLWRAHRQLRVRLYQHYPMTNLLLQLQVLSAPSNCLDACLR